MRRSAVVFGSSWIACIALACGAAERSTVDVARSSEDAGASGDALRSFDGAADGKATRADAAPARHDADDEVDAVNDGDAAPTDAARDAVNDAASDVVAIPTGYTCTTGDASECGTAVSSGPAELWTGTQCCIDTHATAGVVICTTGTKYYCEGNFNVWTGTECCVLDAKSCTPLVDPSKPFAECNGSTSENTGTMCCSRS